MAAPPPPLLLVLSLLPLLSLRAPGARAAPPPLPALLLAAAASAEDYDAVRSSLRELEAQALRAALLQAQAAEQAREGWGEGGGEPLPLPLALAGRAPAYGAAPFDLSKEEQPPVKKMKSYMSLCLFKICNMGRKRTNRS